MGLVFRGLPQETLELIIQFTWTSTVTPKARTLLYFFLSAAHPRLHQIAIHVSTRFVMVDITDLPTEDLPHYFRTITADAAASRMGFAHDSDELRAALFSKSHVCLRGYGVVDRDSGTGATHMLRSRGVDPFLSALASIIGDCRALTAAAPPRFPYLHLFECVKLFYFLQRFPSLTSVRIDFLWDYPEFAPKPVITPFLSVRFLRLRQWPPCPCSCQREATEDNDGLRKGCQRTCMAGTLAEIFPALQELHIDTPVSLVRVLAPPVLEVLTLEAPAVPPLTRGTLALYEIEKVLSMGFMRARVQEAGEDAARRRIRVYTARARPEGWEEAYDACERHGVALVQLVSY